MEMVKHFYSNHEEGVTAINCKELKAREEVEEEKEIESGKERKLRKGIEECYKVCLQQFQPIRH